jgi:hypothetical protein
MSRATRRGRDSASTSRSLSFDHVDETPLDRRHRAYEQNKKSQDSTIDTKDDTAILRTPTHRKKSIWSRFLNVLTKPFENLMSVDDLIGPGDMFAEEDISMRRGTRAEYVQY